MSPDGRLFVHNLESPHTDDPNPETFHFLNLDYELHQGTNLDCLIFESSKMLECSEIQLLTNLWDQERTENLTFWCFQWKIHVWLYANWKTLYVHQYRWQPRLAISLPPWCVLYHMWWTNAMKKSLSSTKTQSSSSIQSPDKSTQMPRSKIARTGLGISFGSTWKMKTLGSLSHPLKNIGNGEQCLDQNDWLLNSKELLKEQEMLYSAHEQSYLTFETIFLSALLQEKPYKIFLANSLSPA